MVLRQLIAFFLATLMAFTSANAYVAEHLREESTPAQESLLQMQSAVLLNENGTPRCFIGQWPNEYFNAEKLGELNSHIDLNTFNDLGECDENDEFYARSILTAEEISYGVVMPPVPDTGRAIIAGVTLGGMGGCLFRALNPLWDSFGGIVISIPLMMAAFFGAPFVVGSFLGNAAGEIAFLASVPGNGVGAIVCDKIAQVNKYGNQR